ncbi:MAG: hypothetical protein AAGE84_11800 [Cyanobacteria bacterium P01_G01_bin.39]
MAAKQDKRNTELSEIKTLINDRFNQLDRKLDETKAELKQNITETTSELKQDITKTKAELKQDITETKAELKQDISDIKGDIKVLHAEVAGVEKRLSNVENSVAKIPEITEKFGELKNWRQTAFVIIAGVVSAFLGWIVRGGKV